MAQARFGPGGRARRTARRFGLLGWGVAATVVVGVAVLAALLGPALTGGGVSVERADPAARQEEPAGEETPVAKTLIVHVDGAVASPGVYGLPEGARVGDAVDAAGGLAEGADTTALNLAAPLSDGQKVLVPIEGEAGGAGAQEGSGTGAGLVNLNTAGVEDLDELPGVGEATARAIVEDRELNGPFSAPEDLMRVSGIGEKKFARLEGMVCV